MKIACITPYHKFDHLAATVIEGLQKHNVEVIASDLGNGIKSCPDEKTFIKKAQDADWVFVIWGKQPGKLHLVDKFDYDKLVYIDGSELTCTGHESDPGQIARAKCYPKDRKGNPWLNKEMLNKCAYYFKRECYPEDQQISKVYPLPFGARDDNFNRTKTGKDIDIFCSFSHTLTGLREEILQSCKDLSKEGYRVDFGSDYDYKTYKKITARSRISVDAWGAGDCNARLFEAIACGSACAFQDWNIVFPYKFQDGREAIVYNTADEFKEKARHYLNNKDQLEQITKNGYKKLLDFHTSYRRLEYIFDIISNF